ncbi:hypothetical protein H1V43_32285 [Streptomyces sp. PSKA54]|uniref:Uncharacterized protein n=1 Tax=Streptomyces himalayensis subsp. aureolus TaxID=2758039 RepID=A0A7W2D779_9ACTN|nr:hypothetical protein [Streptomyces himalayensis]MBA4865943.1 hypothetical protein [Streptomyces himalayensis subsp. aureolus]
MADIPDELINLERTAEAEREKLAGLDGEEHAAQWRRWREAAEAFHAAVTQHSPPDGNRYELEMAVKKAVRHPEPEAAAA